MAIKGAATALDMQKQLYYIQELTQKLQDWERRYWPKILVPRFLEIFGDYVWGLGDRHLRALHRVTELLARLCRLSFDSYVSFFCFLVCGLRTVALIVLFNPNLDQKSQSTRKPTHIRPKQDVWHPKMLVPVNPSPCEGLLSAMWLVTMVYPLVI
jgi:hypothetical protein